MIDKSLIDIEFRVVADHKERLLLEIGQAVIRSGFTLLRQRLVSSPDGVVLTVLVRGPEHCLLALEETLATHPRVYSFEALARDEGEFAKTSAPIPMSPPNRGLNNTPARVALVPAAAETPFDSRRIEAIMPMLALDYPKVFPRLLALEHDLGHRQRGPGLRYIGTRVGAWVYKRDFLLGGKLSMDDSIRYIALPAARQLVAAESNDKGLRVKGSLFCNQSGHVANCHFFEGFFEGLLNEAGNLGRVRAQESHCRATGSDSCLFEFHTE